MPNGNAGEFYRTQYEDLTLQRLYDDTKGELSLEECMNLLVEMQREEIWCSEHYQVAVDKTPKHGFRGMTLWHVSVKRLDKEPIHDWRDLQDIKNKLCGEEFEGIELYPAESRKVDSANQFHIWMFMKDEKRKRAPMIPVGWTKRYVRDDANFRGSQRKFEKVVPGTTEEPK